MSFFTHIEKMKLQIAAEGGERAAIIIPVLTQIQADIDSWTVIKRHKRAYGSLMLREREGTR